GLGLRAGDGAGLVLRRVQPHDEPVGPPNARSNLPGDADSVRARKSARRQRVVDWIADRLPEAGGRWCACRSTTSTTSGPSATGRGATRRWATGATRSTTTTSEPTCSTP